jgi:type I restriction enzyme, S subunit
MTPQIKQRIEQIRRGEVPDGYKRTKVGLVPEEWKIKRLAQVLRKQTCKNTDNAIHNVLTNSATRGIVDQKDYFDKQIANSENTDNYYIVENGYFVYNPRISVSAPCGPFNKYYGCEKGIMSPLYTVYKYIDCSTDYTEYLSYFFSSANWHRYMNSIANYGARNDRMNVTSDTMSAMPLPYPPLPEQKKIAEILQTQDKLIELQQKKIEELKKLKKAYLSKMLPKKGCNVPEIRFPGFTDPWKQRKLGEMTSLITKGTTPLGKSNSGVVNFVKIESIDESSGNITITQKISLDEHNGYLHRSQLKENDILFSIAGTLGRVTSVKSSILPANTNQALAIIRLKDGCLDYVKTYLKGKAVADFIKKNPTIGAQPNLSLEQVANLEIAIPSEDEQKKIGAFFQQLDNLITLHQRKLEEMKIYKKSLMQLLLTGIVRM